MSALKTYKQAAEELAVPVSWLQRQVQCRLVPHTRLGHYVRFSTEQIEQIRRAAKVEPIKTPAVLELAGRRPRRAA